MSIKKEITKVGYKSFIYSYKNACTYLPYYSFMYEEIENLLAEIDESRLNLYTFLQEKKWDSDILNLTTSFVEKYTIYLSLYFVSIQPPLLAKHILKILLCFSTDIHDDRLTILQANLLYELLSFSRKPFKTEEKDIYLDMISIISIINLIISMTQEFIGMTIQFFTCIPENFSYPFYMNNKMPITKQRCEYFQTDYLILFDKTFHNDVEYSFVLHKREIIFNKVFVTLTGRIMDNENLDDNQKIQKLPEEISGKVIISQKYFINLLKKVPEICSPFYLTYLFFSGEFYEKIT
jgi:hypothetical protein